MDSMTAHLTNRCVALTSSQLSSQQAEWLQKKAAFIPCGTWLENEMRSITPGGFDMVIKPVPSDDASKFSWIDASSGEPFMVFSNGKNPVAGMEFLRCLLSKESAKWFAQNVGSIMPVVGGAEGVDLSSAMTSTTLAGRRKVRSHWRKAP